MVLPPFTPNGVLPAGDYPLTLEELWASQLVTGQGVESPSWDAAWRRPDPDSAKRQLPMWRRYHVELYPHFPGLLSGIRDQFGNERPFPSAFRLSRRAYVPKGIVQIVK